MKKSLASGKKGLAKKDRVFFENMKRIILREAWALDDVKYPQVGFLFDAADKLDDFLRRAE